MKLLITGGHLTPALAIIDYMRNNNAYKSTDFVFVGRKYAVESEQTISLEYKEISSRGIPFISLSAGRLSRIISVRSLIQLLKIPLGFVQAYKIISEQRPQAILSFGGYLALPVAMVSKLFNIPIYTHEQTISPGLTNRMIGYFAQKIFYSFPESSTFFPHDKTILTGNPVRESIFSIQSKPFEVPASLPVIYITGGSLGSHSINDKIFDLIPDLTTRFVVIHQVGDVKEYGDYQKAYRIKKKISSDLMHRYIPVKHFFDAEIGYVYSVADFVIGRAGANTFFELLYLRKPAILIPLPWSANKEQQRHAALFESLQLGRTFEQKQANSELLSLIYEMAKSLSYYKKNFSKIPFQLKQNAAQVIVKTIVDA